MLKTAQTTLRDPLEDRYVCTENFNIADQLIQNSDYDAFERYVRDNFTVLGEQNVDGNSLLHLAIHYSEIKIVRTIIAVCHQHHYKLEKYNKAGKLPLHIARESASQTSNPQTIEKQIFNLLAKENLSEATNQTAISFANSIVQKHYTSSDLIRTLRYKEDITEMLIEIFKNVYNEIITNHSTKYNSFIYAENSTFLDFLTVRSIQNTNLKYISDKFSAASKTSLAGLITGEVRTSLVKADKLPLMQDLTKHLVEVFDQYRIDEIVSAHDNKLYAKTSTYPHLQNLEVHSLTYEVDELSIDFNGSDYDTGLTGSSPDFDVSEYGYQ